WHIPGGRCDPSALILHLCGQRALQWAENEVKKCRFHGDDPVQGGNSCQDTLAAAEDRERGERRSTTSKDSQRKKDIGLHGTDLLLLVFDLLLQLGQLCLQRLHSAVRDADRKWGGVSVSGPNTHHFLTDTMDSKRTPTSSREKRAQCKLPRCLRVLPVLAVPQLQLVLHGVHVLLQPGRQKEKEASSDLRQGRTAPSRETGAPRIWSRWAKPPIRRQGLPGNPSKRTCCCHGHKSSQHGHFPRTGRGGLTLPLSH
ncbi:uncharacterized protein LOC104858516, partial [Fukomys damarensis]|uniref:uncharacterized protein LOC104858516 n=1 Tax=Fukomys damarensis TaxID=885580 RepID=UPI00053F5F04